MARDTDSLKIEKWAATADANAVALPESLTGVTRAGGWPSSYAVSGGNVPPYEVFNQVWRELTALGVEVNTRGLLEWDTAIAYVHPAAVFGSDNKIYVSVADSTGTDPTTDTSDAKWKELDVAGFSPIFAVVSDNARRVIQLASWVGGTGTEPSGVGSYLGASGLVSNVANAVDIRGATGATGQTGAAGATGSKGDQGDAGGDGADGATGPPGLTLYLIYARGSTQPSDPANTAVVINTAGNAFSTDPTGWSSTIPSGTDPLYGCVAYWAIGTTTASNVAFGPVFRISGEAGPAGADGAAGAKGDKGDTGDRGPRGYSGPTGATGAQGPAGNDGADGDDGADGADGQNGTNGFLGTRTTINTNSSITVSGVTYNTKATSSAVTINDGDLLWFYGGGRSDGSYELEFTNVFRGAHIKSSGYLSLSGDTHGNILRTSGSGSSRTVHVYVLTNVFNGTTERPSRAVYMVNLGTIS